MSPTVEARFLTTRSHQGSPYFTRKIVNIDNSQSMRMRVTLLVGDGESVKVWRENLAVSFKIKNPYVFGTRSFVSLLYVKIYSSMCIYYARMSIVSIGILLITLGTGRNKKLRSWAEAQIMWSACSHLKKQTYFIDTKIFIRYIVEFKKQVKYQV